MQQKYLDPKTGQDNAKPTSRPNIAALIKKIGGTTGMPKPPPKPKPHTADSTQFLSPGAPRSYDGAACGEDGINIKPSHKGMLHEDLGVPQGQKVPAGKLNQAADSSDPAERKRANFAKAAKGWNK